MAVDITESVEAPPGGRPDIELNAAEALGFTEPIADSLSRELERSSRYNPETTAGLDILDQKPPVPEESSTPEPAEKPPESEDAPEKPKDSAEDPAQGNQDTPPEPEKPSEPEKPEESAKPAEEPKAPSKVMVNGKEYSTEELSRLVEQANRPPEKPKEEPPAPKPPTPEEVAQRENEFVESIAKNIKADSVLSTDEVETLLTGGEEALPVLGKLVQQVQAKAVLEARRSIYAELDPVLSDLMGKVTPVIEQSQQLEQFTTQQLFEQRHPEFKEAGYLDMAIQVAKELNQRYPEEVKKMTREQYVDEVARQTAPMIQADYQRWLGEEGKSWRDHLKAKKAQPSAPATPTPPPAPQPSQQPQAPAPVGAVPPKPKPPASSSPGQSRNVPEDWQKSVASSLV